MPAGTEPEAAPPLSSFTPAQREALILEHLPQVRLIARRIRERLPESVTVDDLCSAGVIGLISAIDRFDPVHDVKLKTYAEYKIRGAILDSLRSLDWAPRQQRRRSKQIEFAIARLEQRLHRPPAEDEIAEALQLTLEQYHEWLLDAPSLVLGSLETGSPQEDNRDLLRDLADDPGRWPSQILEQKELRRFLLLSVERLPLIEQKVLSMYYFRELTLREIAGVLRLHESRISQIKTQAILRLRSHFNRKWPKGRTAWRAAS